MSEDYCGLLLADFLKSSWLTVQTLVEYIDAFKQENRSRQVTLFHYVNGKKVTVPFVGNRFFLRGSVEYTNPQLTVEDIQGIIGTRLLEVCSNYFDKIGLRKPDSSDVSELC